MQLNRCSLHTDILAYIIYKISESITASFEISTLWAHLSYSIGIGTRKLSTTVVSSMSDDFAYVTVKDDKTIVLEPDAHINAENIDLMTFTFDDGIDITESVAKKNAKNKTPVSFTKRGRSAYAPITVTYPDGFSQSSKFLLEQCIIQHTPALNSQNHTYAKEFVFIGVPSIYLDKIMKDARDNSQMNLENKPNVQELNGYYWLRCNLDKLSHNDTKIVTDEGAAKVSIGQILKEIESSLFANIVFSLSGSMNNDNMEEELDLKDGTYTITMKPTEVYVISDTGIKGPELTDTNNRKKESSAMSESFLANGALAAIAARRLKPASRKQG